MKVGIYGFPGSGKTSTFNILSGHRADTGFGSKSEAHIAAIKVPDERVDRLSAIFSPKKITYAEIHFVDVPGGRRDGNSSGLDPEQLQHLRDADAFGLVLRDFESTYVQAPQDPLGEFLEIEQELIMTDLLTTEKRLAKLKKERKQTRETELLERIVEHLNEEQVLRSMDLDRDEEKLIRGFTLVSLKPIVALINTDDDGVHRERPELEAALNKRNIRHFTMSASTELEILDLDPEERALFFEDIGLKGSSKDAFIQEAYTTLDLISFLTTGPDEVRAWTLTRGTPAVQAAGKIHSDIERGFIRGEVTDYETYVAAEGDEGVLRKQGKLRLEGKEYVVQDGDIVHFRFNV